MAFTPPLSLLRQRDTHRLIPSRHLPGGDSVLVPLAEDDEQLAAIFELESATNDRLLAAQQQLPGIGVEELVFGVPHAAVINAAFCHAHPLGGRFNGPDRGAWYAAFDIATAQAEVAFHKTVQLAEIDRFDDSVTYDDYLSDIAGSFHDLRSAAEPTTRRHAAACLDPDSYIAAQVLAEQLLADNSLGIVYPSVRRTGGTCLACFRPALVAHVRRGKTYRLTWNGTPEVSITVERPT